MKRISFSIITILLLLVNNSYANNSEIDDNSKVKEKNVINNKGVGVFAYDARVGWWWYQETVKDQDGLDVDIKTKMTNKEKLDFEKSDKMTKLMIINNERLEKIQERLDYAFPNLTSIYTVNGKTGEKCLTNSSVDCFEFPLQPEARHVPVMASWLESPTPTNSKEWLKWESKYFNHLGKISVGNRFAFLNGGPSVYQTDTTFVYDDSLTTPTSENNQDIRKSVILDKVKDKLGVMIFLGANTGLESTLDTYSDFKHYNSEYFKDLNKIIVLPSEAIKKMIGDRLNEGNIVEAINFWETANIVIRPDLFTKFNIMVTPSVVATYKKDKEKDVVWQVVHSGSMGISVVRDSMVKFLIYNDIIKPLELSTAINNAEAQRNMVAEEPVVDDSKILNDLNKIKEGYLDENKK